MAERERPWLQSYPPDIPHSLTPYPERPVWSLLEESAERYPDSPAVAFPVAPMARRLTYRQLKAEAERFAGAMAAMGIGKGDPVGLLLPNCPQFVVAWFGLQRLGAVPVGNNPLYTQRELAHQLTDAGVDILVALDLLYPLAGAVREAVGLKTVIVAKVGDYLGFPINKLAPLKQKREARHEDRPWPPVPADAEVTWWSDLMSRTYPEPPPLQVDAVEDVAALVYTGGTTGLSKGAMLTHHNLVSNALQTGAWFSDVKDGEEAILSILPFFHSYGLSAVMNVAISRAMKLILLPRFELKMALKAIDKEKATLFPGVPRIYIAITGGRLVEGYGLTETSPVTHINPIYGKRKFGSIGLPIPDTDCKIVDLDDPEKELPPGRQGELCIAGPQVMKGYWNRPEDTAEMIRVHKDGIRWLHTGDIATVDDEGYFTIVDRKKDMILVSGFNVYPTDVEQVLYRHPKIQQVCVVGVPDAKTGEAVKAFVVLKEGEPATEGEILGWARDEKHGLTGYRAPKSVEFRLQLPTTMVGKVLRRVLLEEERQRAGA